MTKVLAARLDSAGDVLVTGPAIRAIASHPEVSEVALLCGPQGRAAAELLPEPTELFTWASPWTIVPAPPVDDEHIGALRDYVRHARFDEAVIFTSFHQSPLPLALVLRLAGIKRISGASTDFAGSLLDVRLKPGEDFPEDQPEVERALGIAAAAGYELPAGDDGRMHIVDPTGAFFGTPAHLRPAARSGSSAAASGTMSASSRLDAPAAPRDAAGPLSAPAAAPDAAGPLNAPTAPRDAAGPLSAPAGDRASRVLDPDEPYVVVHPGAAVPARMWPPERSAEAVELLSAHGHRVVVTGGPNETALTSYVAGASGIDLGGATDLRGTAEVLSRAGVVICGNTGPAHLSAAVGTPVVSLFSPVVPAVRWAPYGVPVELLGDQDAPCRNSRARDCPVPGHPCLASVIAEDVLAAVERLLAAASAPAASAAAGAAPTPGPSPAASAMTESVPTASAPTPGFVPAASSPTDAHPASSPPFSSPDIAPTDSARTESAQTDTAPTDTAPTEGTAR
ncbi:hypothetical protein GCM10022261_19720 [Brevibacterium daeguense]|uniref:ADP-heptose:LPS heptosyltransferase n=1 Tax=Brevibacterium daeguense TaxID=909936 RepID=A0ABP8EKG1_9MICO|nr:glycosyltransferase family 9 protein [Brevibacterium daeguense]